MSGSAVWRSYQSPWRFSLLTSQCSNLVMQIMQTIAFYFFIHLSCKLTPNLAYYFLIHLSCRLIPNKTQYFFIHLLCKLTPIKDYYFYIHWCFDRINASIKNVMVVLLIDKFLYKVIINWDNDIYVVVNTYFPVVLEMTSCTWFLMDANNSELDFAFSHWGTNWSTPQNILCPRTLIL